MKPKPKRIHSGQAIDPRNDPRLLTVRARDLKKLAHAYMVEFLAEVEALGTNCELSIEHGLSLPEEVRRFEIDLIKCALERTGGHQRRAAALLGVKASTLNRKVKIYHLKIKVVGRIAEHESNVLSVSRRRGPILASDVLVEDHGATTVN